MVFMVRTRLYLQLRNFCSSKIYLRHFPELIRIVSDDRSYIQLAAVIGDKNTWSEENLSELAAIVDDDIGIAQSILDAAKVSMGRELSSSDHEHFRTFAIRSTELIEARTSLQGYLASKMNAVAPNLAALIGNSIGARVISKAGSLTNLSKYPACPIQILGAEKALFRALKTKGNTPKYGLIYHSPFIGKVTRHKGRISRFLANKCAIASRIDSFSETPNAHFGNALRNQVEERIQFY